MNVFEHREDWDCLKIQIIDLKKAILSQPESKYLES